MATSHGKGENIMGILHRVQPGEDEPAEPEDDTLSPIPAVDVERYQTYLAHTDFTSLVRGRLDGRDVTIIAVVDRATATGAGVYPVAILLDDETTERLVPPPGTVRTDTATGDVVTYA